MAKKITKQKSKESLSITFSEPFAATVERKPNERYNSLKIVSPVFYHHQLNKFKPGTKVTLEVHTRKAKRTDQQNRYLWGAYYPIIAQETGERNLDRLHELFKSLFLTTGIVEVLGRKVRMKKSTTNMSVSEFCEFISSIETETGIEPPPVENWDLAPLREPRDDEPDTNDPSQFPADGNDMLDYK